jgi:hypothetical protein
MSDPTRYSTLIDNSVTQTYFSMPLPLGITSLKEWSRALPQDIRLVT